MNDLPTFKRKTTKVGKDASLPDDVTPVPSVEPSIYSARPDTGSQTSLSRAGDKSADVVRQERAQKHREKAAESQTWKPRGNRKHAKRQSRKGRGGEINLGKAEDRAWLGALIVGDGSIYATGSKNAQGKKHLYPMVSVIMCDRSAIEKAARLIGVRRTASYKARITGRRLWRVQAVGARALQVLDLVKPFLTQTRIGQAARAIEKARAAGYRTRREIEGQNKLRILKLVRLEPGCSTRRIRSCTRLDTAYLRRYLDELAKEGKVRKVATRASSQVWHRWFPVEIQENSIPVGLSQAGENDEVSKQSAAMATSHIVTWFSPMPGGRRYEPRLDNPLDRAWLGGLTDAEGTVGTFRPKGSSHCIPRMAIRMLDKEAIDRAAALMGVTSVRAGISKRSRKQFWQANAVGGRAIRILDIIRPYLTRPKFAQAERAINKARKSGFRTIREMQAVRKETIFEYVKRNPGALTTEIVNGASVDNKNARKYLAELEGEGKVRKVVGGTSGKPNTRWFPVENRPVSQ